MTDKERASLAEQIKADAQVKVEQAKMQAQMQADMQTAEADRQTQIMLKDKDIAWEREKMQMTLAADMQKHREGLVSAQMGGGNG